MLIGVGRTTSEVIAKVPLHKFIAIEELSKCILQRNKHYVSHDQITRFLSAQEYTSKDLWQQVKSTVRLVERKDGLLIFMTRFRRRLGPMRVN